MRKGYFVPLTACALGLLLVGCSSGGNGSGGQSSEVSESSISKKQYVAKAEKICKNGEKKLQVDFGTFVKTNKAGVEHPTEATYVDLVNSVVAPDIEHEIEELRELGAPKGDGKKVEAVLKARVESIGLAEKDPRAITTNGAKLFYKSGKAAIGYGLKACAIR